MHELSVFLSKRVAAVHLPRLENRYRKETTGGIRRIIHRHERSVHNARRISPRGVSTLVTLDIQSISFIRGRILHGESYKAYRLITP